MNPDEILDDDEECFVIPVPPESDEDDEETEIVFAVLPLEDGLAILDQA